MNKRSRHFSIYLGLSTIAIILVSIWCFQATGTGESPAEIYNQRLDRGYEYAVSRLRIVHRQHPNDSETRYFLASLLIESAKDEKALDESLGLLGGYRLSSQPDWLPLWSHARRLQAYGSGLLLLTAEGSPLNRAVNLPNGDAQLKSFVTDSLKILAGIDRKLTPDPIPSELASKSKKKTLTGDEVREDLFALKNLLGERWAYIAEKEKQTGKSLAVLLAEALGKVQPQMTLAETSAVLLQFVANLEDGHTHIGYVAPRFSLPFRVVETHEGLIVAETAKAGLGIEVGDRLVSVDGESAMAALESRQKVTISSTAAGRHALAVRVLESHWGEERGYQVAIERRGQITTTEMKAWLIDELPWSAANQNALAKPWISTRSLSPGVAYMQVLTWWPPTQSGAMNDERLSKHKSEIDAAVAEIKTAKDLVLDLRNNSGGSDSLCAYLASFYVHEPMNTYVLRYRILPETPLLDGSDGFQNPERNPANYPRQQGEILKTRIWVLMNAGSFSATDTMLNILTRNIPDRVTTIGQANGSGIGGPTLVGHLRNSGFALTCSTCQAYSTDGDLLEGHPVKLNYPVQWTQADVISGTDADLEKALKLIAAAGK